MGVRLRFHSSSIGKSELKCVNSDQRVRSKGTSPRKYETEPEAKSGQNLTAGNATDPPNVDGTAPVVTLLRGLVLTGSNSLLQRRSTYGESLQKFKSSKATFQLGLKHRPVSHLVPSTTHRTDNKKSTLQVHPNPNPLSSMYFHSNAVPLRTHRKSRNGCAACKARRVKVW